MFIDINEKIPLSFVPNVGNGFYGKKFCNVKAVLQIEISKLATI